MITIPKHLQDSPAKLQDIILTTKDGNLNAKESAYYHIKDLDYRNLPLLSSKFFVHTGKNKNNLVSTTLNTAWVRWKDRVVILIESTDLTVSGDTVTVYLADVTNVIENLTSVSGVEGNNYVDVPGGVTIAVFRKKFLHITGTGDDKDSIYEIDHYDSNKLYLKEELNNDITTLTADIVDKTPGSTYFWKDVPIQSDYDIVKASEMGTSDFGVYNLDPGPAAAYPWPSAITKSGTTIFYVILDNSTVYMEDTKQLFKDLTSKNMHMESKDVSPGTSLFDLYKNLDSIDTYVNQNSLFFNEIDMDITNWYLYSFNTSLPLAITSVVSSHSGTYKITVTSSALPIPDNDYYLYYKPYNMVFKGSKQSGTTVDFTEILPYNMEGDLSTSSLFGTVVSGENTYLVADYLRLNRDFILAPRSNIFILNDELYIQNVQLNFNNGTYTETEYTLGSPVDLDAASVDKYIIYAKIRNGSTNFQHTINVMSMVAAATFSTDRLTTYGDCIAVGILEKTGASAYGLTLYGIYFPSFAKLETYNAPVEGSVSIGNVVNYNTSNSQWEKTPLATIPHAICEDAALNRIVFEGEANIPGLVPETWYYLDDTTPGLITTNQSSGIQVGYSLSADRLLIQFRDVQDSVVHVRNQDFETGGRAPSTSLPAVEYNSSTNKWQTCTIGTVPFGYLNGDHIVFAGLITSTGAFSALTPGQTYYMSDSVHGQLTTSDTGIQVGRCLDANTFLVQIIKTS